MDAPKLPTGVLLHWAIALVVAILIALRGYRKQSLSSTGALAAFAVGSIGLGTQQINGQEWPWICGMDALLENAGTGWMWGLTLLSFYFSGSAFTKYKASQKQLYDLENKGGEGHRNWVQVFATAGVGSMICLAYLKLFGYQGPAIYALVLPWAAEFSKHEADCWHTILLIAYMGCVTSGLRTASQHVSPAVTEVAGITCRLKRVPRGTNGGVSAWGTLVSALGGLFIGFVAYACIVTPAVLAASSAASLHKAIMYGSLAPAQTEYSSPMWWLLVLGCAAGLLGSLIDSVLGALLQRSWLHNKSAKATSRLPPGEALAGEFSVICGFDILSNEQINLLSAVLTSALLVFACAGLESSADKSSH